MCHYPPPQRAGDGREDKVGLTQVTLPSKCLLCNGEPHSLIRTKAKARPHSPSPGCVVIDGKGAVEVGGMSSEATPASANPVEGRAALTLPEASSLKMQTLNGSECICTVCCLVTNSCPTLLKPCGLQPTRLLFPWGFPGKHTGVGCHFLLQGSSLPPGGRTCVSCIVCIRRRILDR